MRMIYAAAALAAGLALTPVAAAAQERIVDGALGAGAGALVGGPVGAIVGGAVGFTAGPHIARGMGVHHRSYRHHSSRHKHRTSTRTSQR